MYPAVVVLASAARLKPLCGVDVATGRAGTAKGVVVRIQQNIIHRGDVILSPKFVQPETQESTADQSTRAKGMATDKHARRGFVAMTGLVLFTAATVQASLF